MTYTAACDYVRTDITSGLAQFVLMCCEGLPREAKLLEVGCGALHAARPVLAYLDLDGYCGIDPSVWLRDAARAADPVLDNSCFAKGARFSDRDDFDGSEFGESFDMVFAHSVLSHVSPAQLTEFMIATRKVLAPGGVVLASINLGDSDTAATEWTYPGGVCFTLPTADASARAAGYDMAVRAEYRTLYASIRPEETHDWIVLR